MRYAQFEDLPVWQESRVFVGEVYALINTHKKLSLDFSLMDQLKRSAYSILLNISEGFERGTNKEFANFLNISKGSAGEVRSILYVLLDNGYIAQQEFNRYRKMVCEISAHLAGFRAYLLSHSEYRK